MYKSILFPLLSFILTCLPFDTIKGQTIICDSINSETEWRYIRTDYSNIAVKDSNSNIKGMFYMSMPIRHKSERFEFFSFDFTFTSNKPIREESHVKLVFKDDNGKYKELWVKLFSHKIDIASPTYDYRGSLSIQVNKESKDILLKSNITKLKIFLEEPITIEFKNNSFSLYVRETYKIISERLKQKQPKIQKYNF